MGLAQTNPFGSQFACFGREFEVAPLGVFKGVLKPGHKTGHLTFVLVSGYLISLRKMLMLAEFVDLPGIDRSADRRSLSQ
jgi:hypothetical protein